MRFASGAIGNIHMNLFAWNVHSHFEIMGEKGVIQWRRFENEIRVFDPTANRWEIYPFGCQLNDMYVEEARHFLACIRGEAAARVRRLGRSQDDARHRRGSTGRRPSAAG